MRITLARKHNTVLRAGSAIVLWLALAFAWCAASGAAAKEVSVTIYNTGDLHENTATLGQIARFVKQRKANDPNVLFVDAGDWTNKGELPIMATRGEAMAALMGACGYDACILGNHDFVYGARRVSELVDRFSFPLLAANCVWPKGVRPGNSARYKFFEFNGVRVAVIGTAAEVANRRMDAPLLTTRIEDAIGELVPVLRERADIVVLVTHSGTKRDLEIARNVPGIDVIIGGHDHACHREMLFDAESATVIQHSGAAGRTLGEVTLKWNGDKIVDRSTRVIDFPIEDPEVRALRDKYVGALPLEGALTQAPRDLTRAEATRWLAEGVRRSVDADVVLVPKELVSRPLGAGKVTPRSLLPGVPRLEVMRFSVEGPDALRDLLVHVREANPSIVCTGLTSPRGGGAIRCAYPCVHYGGALRLEKSGLDSPLVKDLERVTDRSLWHIAIGEARSRKTLVVPGEK